jgi:RHS repeat-associated protein
MNFYHMKSPWIRSGTFLGVLLLATLPVLAADKSGVGPNTISLPGGPGSIEGLGESFQPTLNTGTAKSGLGLNLPPGTAGHQPTLRLGYDGGEANGPLGYGWSLPVARIQRRTDKGIPTYGEDLGVDRPDVFLNHQKEELVPGEDGFWFCANETAFLRYRQLPEGWEATTPTGTRLVFGTTADSRITDDLTGRVFSWLLERETDTRGNVIEYSYRSFPDEENRNQKYLARIRYGPGAPPWTHHHFVTFEYEDRQDWFEDGRPGFLVRTGKRLRSVVIGTQGVELPDHLAGDFDQDGIEDFLNRRYDLQYARYAGDASHWSLLAHVTLIGADGQTALPPATFHYAVSNPPDDLSASDYVWGSIDEPFAVMDNELVDLIDLNGDGLPDILKTEPGGGAHTVSVNLGPVRQGADWAVAWSAPSAIDPGQGTAWNFDLASDRTHLADMDGDGLADLVHRSADDAVFYFPNRGVLAWGERHDMSVVEVAPPSPFGNPNVRTADLDFDKRIDIIQSLDVGGGVAYRVWFNLGNQNFSPAVFIEPEVGLDLSLPGVHIADCNGDRVPDIARILADRVWVTPGLGYARFASPRMIALPDVTLDGDQIARARLTDINGDGLADLVLERGAPGECWYWLNLGNYTFTARKRITDLPSVSGATAVRWADLNGNGTTDLVYADAQSTPRIRFVELGELINGGLAPNLLMRIDNGIGRVTDISYAPSTHFALTDAAADEPWPDPLPFPVTVVTEVRVSDSLGHTYLTRFQYHDGYYDPAEKQFRGFGRVEQIDIGDDAAPTLVTRSRFDTGRTFDAMKGRLLRATSATEDGRIFSQETTLWADPPRLLLVGTNGASVRYAHPTASVKDVIELGHGSPRRIESEFDFDEYGNQTRVAHYGVVEEQDRSAWNDERITVTEYAINPDAWILRLPMRQIITDENGAVSSRREMFYDDPTFAGDNLGVVTVGNLTMERDWIDPTDPMAFVNTSRTRHDPYGNPIALFDPLWDPDDAIGKGHFRDLIYDDSFHTYPVREIMHGGAGRPPLVFQATYDEGLGTVRNSTDFNGNTTHYGHDGFGRLTSLIKPGDTADYPTAEYAYALAIPTATGGLVNFVETRQLDRDPNPNRPKADHYLVARQFADGLGRALMSRSEAEPAAGESAPRVVVTGAVLFNARQKAIRTLNPHFTQLTGSLDDMLAFEEIEAPGWQGLFHDQGDLVALDLSAAHQSATEYDATLRAIRTINPDGTFLETQFEPLVTRVLDENDVDPDSIHFATPTILFGDGLGRLIRTDEIVRLNDDGSTSIDLRTWTTGYQYDRNDQLTRITDSQGNVKSIRYDGLRRRTWSNDPDSGISVNTYDAASNLIETVDAKGQRITHTYDGINRILTEEYHDEDSAEFSYHRTPDVRYHYDIPAVAVDHGDGTRATARNTRGMLAWIEDASGREHQSFDARGRVEWIVKQLVDPVLTPTLQPDPANLVSYRTAFDYDSMDRVTRMTFPDNDQVSYRYNARSLLEQISGGPTGSILAGIEYLPGGEQAQLDYGNDVRTRYHYDARLRLRRILTRHLTRGTELIHLTYDLDPVSNVRAIHDQRPVLTVPTDDPRRNSQVFDYDNLYRLTHVRYNAPHPVAANGGHIRYRYDRIGNMLEQTSDMQHIERGSPVTDPGTMAYGGTGGATGRIGRHEGDPPGPHAVTEISRPSSARRDAQYDANGNLTELDGLRFTWDFRDRLVAVEDDSMRAAYRYDYTGRRVIKRVLQKPFQPPDARQPAQPDPGSSSTSVLYPGKHFEVREHDEPTKFIFAGPTRVARITGSLSSQHRVQRIRLHPGWNLVVLAVTAEDALEQLSSSIPSDGGADAGLVQSVYQWNPDSGDYSTLEPGHPVSAGTILWIQARASNTISIVGLYMEPVNRVIDADGSFVPGAGLERWDVRVPLEHLASGAAWYFDALRQAWVSQLSFIPISDTGFPQYLAPGQGLFLTANAPAELEIPNPALRIRYYHQDHLGSSNVITDDDGAVIEESTFHPFGAARHSTQRGDVPESYQFAQKERDQETGWHYFEARYLASPLGRFASPDPKYAHPADLSLKELSAFLARPQKLNLYAYALNNPLRFNDPSGLDETDAMSTIADVVGLYAGIVEEVHVWTHAISKGGQFAAGAASKGATGVSLTIKAGQFIQDPSAATGGQLLNEGAKTLVSVVAAPVGIIWSVLDLTGYGPSSILESIEKSIEYNRAATRAYEQTTKVATESARRINEQLPGLQQKFRAIETNLDKLNAGIAKLKATQETELKRLNAQIKSYERQIQHQKQELRHWNKVEGQ